MLRLTLSRLELIALALTSAIAVALGVLVLALRTPEAPLRVAYLSSESGAPNVWAVVPGTPERARQLTFAANGVYDFAPSPDGRRLAYSERAPAANRSDLKLLDLASGAVTVLADCAAHGADCTSPAWRPDGSAIAYVRSEPDPALGSLPRIWIVEGLENGAYEQYRMFDAQTTGSQPVWSQDGQILATYEETARGVLVFDFDPDDPSQSFTFVPADNGMTGALSPDGTILITSMLQAIGEDSFRSAYAAASLPSGETTMLFSDESANDGTAAAFHPDGRRLAVLRQYRDSARATQGQQVYLYDVLEKRLTPLIVDRAYNHGLLSFSPDGAFLLVQRYSFETQTPTIWLYEMATGALTLVADGAHLPAWIPATE